MQPSSPEKAVYKKKRIDELVIGDILLQPLYRSDGLLLIDRYKHLDESLIHLIRKHITPDAWILVALEAVSEVSGLTVNETENPIINALTSCPYWNYFDARFESDRLQQRSAQIKIKLLDLIKQNKAFDNFYIKIKNYADSLVIHSLNTACVALMIGLTMELSDEQLQDVAIAALFSNIGFIEMPKNNFKTLLKTQAYDNTEMKKHIEVFTDITSSSPYLRKKNIIQGILDHHEYYSGKGYPNEKKVRKSVCSEEFLISHLHMIV